MYIPIWNDSWQSDGTMSTISNWGILNPLAINTGSVVFHSSRSSSIVLETIRKYNRSGLMSEVHYVTKFKNKVR